MKVRTLLWVCAVGILSASVAMAQRHGGGGQGPGGGQGQGGQQGTQGFDAMLGQLELTDKQQAEVDKLREKMKAATEKSTGNQEAMRQAMQDFRTKVLALLTPEQKKKLDEIRAQHRGPGGHGGQGRHGGGQTQ